MKNALFGKIKLYDRPLSSLKKSLQN